MEPRNLLREFQPMTKAEVVFRTLAIAIVGALVWLTLNAIENRQIRCVETSNTGKTIHGPFVIEYWSTADNPLHFQDGSQVPVERKSILLFTTGNELFDNFPTGTARYWIGGNDKVTRVKYNEIVQSIPDAGDYVAVTFAPDEPHGCPAGSN